MTIKPTIDRLAVIGVGLIGGSLALALRRAGVVGEVIGCSRSAGRRDEALRLGIIDRATADPDQAANGADLVVIATPVGATAQVLGQIKDALSPFATVTDAGSVKTSVIEAAAVLGPAADRFVPGHPIAGTENSGPAAAHSTLFQGRRVILTPTATTNPQALERVRGMWRDAGALVSEMGAGQHDEIFAATSHLPHALAYCLMEMLASGDGERLRYTAGGFQDFTRIASSDPEMWRDICLANREPLLRQLRDFGYHLDALSNLVERADGAGLLDLFRRAKKARDGIVTGNGGGE